MFRCNLQLFVFSLLKVIVRNVMHFGVDCFCATVEQAPRAEEEVEAEEEEEALDSVDGRNISLC